MGVNRSFWKNLLVVFLGVCLLRTGVAINYNRGMYQGFTQRYEEWNPDWNGEEIKEYMSRNRFGGMYVIWSSVETVTLTRPLRYYTQPSIFSQVAVELKAGERYALFGEYNYGCGSHTFPTGRRGWRCAVPLAPSDADSAIVGNASPHWQDLSYYEGELYYVRLEDLVSVARDFYLQILPENVQYIMRRRFYWDEIPVKDMFRQLMDPFLYYSDDPSNPNRSIEHIGDVQGKFTSFDREFYRRGCCISPDLLKPLWDWWNTVMVFGALICAGVLTVGKDTSEPRRCRFLKSR